MTRYKIGDIFIFEGTTLKIISVQEPKTSCCNYNYKMRNGSKDFFVSGYAIATDLRYTIPVIVTPHQKQLSLF